MRSLLNEKKEKQDQGTLAEESVYSVKTLINKGKTALIQVFIPQLVV